MIRFVNRVDCGTALGSDLATEEALDHDERVGWLVEVFAPNQEATKESHNGVAQGDAMHQHALVCFERQAHLLVDAGQKKEGVLIFDHGPMAVRQTEFFVGLQIVRVRDHGDRQIEIVVENPNNFFLAAHGTVVGTLAAQTLAYCDLVLENPREMTRFNTLRPLASQARNRHLSHI